MIKEIFKKLNFNKIIVLTQFLFISLTIAFFYFYAPIGVNPRDNSVLSGNSVYFDIEKADSIIISRNPDFSDSREIDARTLKVYAIKLPPGVYYWKPVGALEGTIKKFEIVSTVGIELNQTNNSDTLSNVGNVPIRVTQEVVINNTQRTSRLTGLVIDTNSSVNLENDFFGGNLSIVYRAEQYE